MLSVSPKLGIGGLQERPAHYRRHRRFGPTLLAHPKGRHCPIPS